MNLQWSPTLAGELPHFGCGRLAIGGIMAVAYLDIRNTM